jgi:hypothetical protein
MRMHIRRFTRLTNGFSKKVENHAHAVALHFAYYNFVCIHKTLRMTPAMAAGVTDKLWEMADLVAVVEAAEEAPKKARALQEAKLRFSGAFMKKKLLGTALGLVLLSTQAASAQAPKAPTAGTAVSVVRFTIIHSPQTERDVILLDTVTGQSWALTTLTNLNGEPFAWETIPRITTPEDEAAVVTRYGIKSAGQPTPAKSPPISN